jgi:hypothetical protein
VSEALKRIAQRYEDFARFEAWDRLPLYASIAEAVAADPFTLRFLASLPDAKQQPNLLLAAVRYLYVTVADRGGFLELVRAHAEEIATVMAARST